MPIHTKKNRPRATAPAAPRLTLEALEERTLLSVSVRAGVLTILGTTRPDTYVVSLNAPAADRITVTENGRMRSFDRATITAISADGRRGNDLIEIDQANGQILLPTTLVGGDGDDTVIGGGGMDRIDGQAGDDRLRGQAGDDVLSGGLGNDDADGGNGNDMIQGNEGNDRLAGAGGTDSIDGGAGDDTATGGAGTDQIAGGADDDLFDLAEVISGEVQDKGVGTDTAEVPLEDAPDAVQDALDALISDGSLQRLVREFTGNTVSYEADFDTGNLDHSVRLSEAGDVLEQDVEIDAASLPPATFDAVFQRYPTGTISRAEFSTSAGGDLYEVDVKVLDRLHAMTITVDGVIQEDVVEALQPKGKPTRFRDFSSSGSTPFANLDPGSSLTLEGVEDGAQVQLVITALDAIKMIDGVETRIVVERQMDDGQLVEIAKNYFAIDRQTNNLYYFGEDVDNYENGLIINHNSSWRSGVNGAKFGVLVPGLPRIGLSFAQERAPGVALDTGQIVSLNETVVTPAGTFTGVLKVRETSPLEPAALDFKFYAPGIGLVQSNELKLVSHT